MRQEVNEKDAVSFVTRELNNRGIRIRDRTVKLILDVYFRYKKDRIAEGNVIDEPNISKTYCKFRRGSTFSGKVLPTVKLVCDFDKNLKKLVVENLISNKVLQNDLVGDDREPLSEEEITFLRRKFKLKNDDSDLKDEDFL